MKNESIILPNLTKDGKYKYVGFILRDENAVDGQDKDLGTALVCFKDVKTNEIFFIFNHNISGADAQNPYGVFTGSIGNWNSMFDIVFTDGIALISY